MFGLDLTTLLFSWSDIDAARFRSDRADFDDRSRQRANTARVD
jgi:hypothetical protein